MTGGDWSWRRRIKVDFIKTAIFGVLDRVVNGSICPLSVQCSHLSVRQSVGQDSTVSGITLDGREVADGSVDVKRRLGIALNVSIVGLQEAEATHA